MFTIVAALRPESPGCLGEDSERSEALRADNDPEYQADGEAAGDGRKNGDMILDGTGSWQNPAWGSRRTI